jgi:hypothetical protein
MTLVSEMCALRSQIQEVNAALPETAVPLDHWVYTYHPNDCDPHDLRCSMTQSQTIIGRDARRLACDAMRRELLAHGITPCV